MGKGAAATAKNWEYPCQQEKYAEDDDPLELTT